MTEGHVHDCSGPTATCPCGYVFRVPPVCASLEITKGQRVVLSEGFNCETIAHAISVLRGYLDKVEEP